MDGIRTESNIGQFEDLIGPMPERRLRRFFVSFIFLITGIALVVGLVDTADKLHGNITITSLNPPVPVMATIDGFIHEVMVEDKQMVKKDQLLAQIELEMDIAVIEQLADHLDQIKAYEKAPDRALQLLKSLPALEGELDVLTLSLQQEINNYIEIRKDPLFDKKRQTYQEQLLYRKKLSVLMEEEFKSKHKAYVLEKGQFEISQSLFDSGLVSKVQYFDAQKRLLNTEFEVQTQKTEMERNNLDAEDIKNNIHSLEIDYQRDLKNAQEKIDELLLDLHSMVHSMEHMYNLRAPTSGLLEYFEILDAGQMISSQDPMFIITPGENRTIGRMSIPESNTAELKKGKVVRVKLNKYPFKDWGVLEGEIISLTNVPIGGEYRIQVSFPDGFITTYGKKLAYTNQLEGKAEIILQKRSFFDRIFTRIRSN